jgi:hypothetical protein
MLTFPFTGRLRDFGSFCWLSPTFFLLTPRTLLVNLFLSFSPSPLNPPYTTRERYLPIVFFFFSLICWRNVTKRSIFGEGFFVSVSVCSKMNEFVRFLCDQGTGIFVCCFGIGCTVPYIIIFFCLFVSHTFVIFMILISLYLIVLLKAF